MRQEHRESSQFSVGTVILGKRAEYNVTALQKAGRRSYTYIARISKMLAPRSDLMRSAGLKNGSAVVLKTVNPEVAAYNDDIVGLVRRVNFRLEAEEELIRKLASVANVAKIVDIGNAEIALPRGGSCRATVLVQQRIRGRDLAAFVRSTCSRRGFSDARHWFSMATKLAGSLLEVHHAGVVHRDIWPENIMVYQGRPIYIDFGDSMYRDALVSVDADPVRSTGAAEFAYVPPEWRQRRSWASRRSDIYSLGGVLLFLASGRDPASDLPKNDTELKSYVCDRVNPDLLTTNPGIPDIIVPCLRHNRENRGDSEMLLQRIATFDRIGRPNLRRAETQLRAEINKLEQKKSLRLFTRFAEIDVRSTLRNLRDMTNGIRDLTGSREEIEWHLATYLSVLQPGDEYLTLTTAAFWSEANLSVHGPFLSMNRLAAQRGVTIRRLFLLTERDLRSGAFAKTAAAHVQMEQSLPPDQRGRMATRCRIVKPSKLDKVIGEVGNGVWISSDTALRVVCLYDKQKRLRTIRMVERGGNVEALRTRFSEQFAHPQSKPLHELAVNPPPIANDRRATILISYAREDKRFVAELTAMLQPASLPIWSDKDIGSSEVWQAEIQAAVQKANVAILLISKDFLASDFIRNVELPLIRAQKEKIDVHWLPVRPADWGATEFARIQCLINPARALSEMPVASREATLKRVCEKLRRKYSRQRA